MFTIFFFFHILLFLESFILYKRKLRKKSMLLIITNVFLLLINLIRFWPTFKIDYSSINYLEEAMISHSIINRAWILLNLINIVSVIYIIKYANKKKKQNRFVKESIYLVITIMTIIFIRLLFFKTSAIIILFFLIYLICLLIKEYIKNKHNYIIITILLLVLGIYYSYFTYTGAARFEILLKGYPKEAYETGLEELKYFEEKNNKKFSPIQIIKLHNGEIGIIEVKKYLFIKIGISNKI